MSHIGSKSFLSLCLPTHTRTQTHKIPKDSFRFFYSLGVLLVYQKNLELLHSHFEQLSRKNILVIDLLIVRLGSFLFGVMGVVVCVCSCCPDPAGGRSAACSHWIRHHLLSFCIGCTHTHTSAWQLVCTLTYTHAWKLRPQSDCKVKLVDQQHPPHTSSFPPSFPTHLAVWASHLSALGLSSLPFLFSLPFLCRCSRSLLPISLSSSPPLLFRLSSPDGSTRDLLAWPSAVALMLFPVSPAAHLVWLLHQCKEKLQLQ